MKKIIAIIGARPQFIKHFPIEKASEGIIDLVSIHTGQHYDENMSKVFFDQLGMKKPDFLLSNGGGNHGTQTGKMMIDIEAIVLDQKPDAVLVYGDTNSTLAGALVASKLHVPVIHIEAGLRSFNKKMPEEINRILTDHISELLFVPNNIAKKQLKSEGIHRGVFVVGDVMKDLLFYSLKFIDKTDSAPYYYATIHRPYNTDDEERLKKVLNALNEASKHVIFAIHPRTKNAMLNFGLEQARFSNITFIDPQPYFENLSYLFKSDGLVTDSGGMQKEAYWLEKPCVTVRTETEWTETTLDNANTLMFEDLKMLSDKLSNKNINFNKELYGSGSTAKQIVNKINRYFL